MAGAILFVCAANRCRSPLAMAVLQSLAAEQPVVATWRIESAGLHALPDLPATPHTVEVAREAGLDLHHHRARNVEQVRLQDFDLILTLEQNQAETLASAFPHLTDTIRLFSALVNLQVDIEDPTAYGLVEHRALLTLLTRYLRAGLPRLHNHLTVRSR